MRYSEVVRGVFLERPNRFIAKVEIAEESLTVHVKNTGRIRELLVPGAEVYLEKAANPERKTPYDLIAVRRGDSIVNIDSQAPNTAAEEYLRKRYPRADIRREVRHGDSRFDFYVEEDGKGTFIEVKGVTLIKADHVEFPDAPTERGTKHVRGLRDCLAEGYGAEVLFVVQLRGARYFCPNRDTDPVFSDELAQSFAAGVDVRAVECEVSQDRMDICGEIEVRI